MPLPITTSLLNKDGMVLPSNLYAFRSLGLILLVGLTLLPGCARVGNPPSLAMRPEETPAATNNPLNLTTAQDLAVDEGLNTQLKALIASAQDAQSQFEARLTASRSVLNNGLGAKPGSEAWVERQPALAVLRLDRQRAAEALADLDALVLREGAAAADDKDRKLDFRTAQDAQALVAGIVSRMTDRLMGLETPDT